MKCEKKVKPILGCFCECLIVLVGVLLQMILQALRGKIHGSHWCCRIRSVEAPT